MILKDAARHNCLGSKVTSYFPSLAQMPHMFPSVSRHQAAKPMPPGISFFALPNYSKSAKNIVFHLKIRTYSQIFPPASKMAAILSSTSSTVTVNLGVKYFVCSSCSTCALTGERWYSDFGTSTKQPWVGPFWKRTYFRMARGVEGAGGVVQDQPKTSV
jgi:hypothetical protein